jgi:hypothetical protein
VPPKFSHAISLLSHFDHAESFCSYACLTYVKRKRTPSSLHGVCPYPVKRLTDRVLGVIHAQIHHLPEKRYHPFPRELIKMAALSKWRFCVTIESVFIRVVGVCQVYGGFMAIFRPICPDYSCFMSSTSKIRPFYVENLSPLSISVQVMATFRPEVQKSESRYLGSGTSRRLRNENSAEFCRAASFIRQSASFGLLSPSLPLRGLKQIPIT